MNPLAALGLPTSAPGIPGGGGTVSQKSAAESALNSSGSAYNLSSGTPGDLIVGGQKNSPWMILGIAAVGIFLLLKARK